MGAETCQPPGGGGGGGDNIVEHSSLALVETRCGICCLLLRVEVTLPLSGHLCPHKLSDCY